MDDEDIGALNAALKMSSIFDGDGRTMVQPTVSMPNTNPMAVSRSSARNAIRMFEETGRSIHSREGLSLWVIIQHCTETRKPYSLRVDPALGFMVELSSP